jgi:hypothetical protein
MVAALGDAPEITITAATLTDLGLCDSNRVQIVRPAGVSSVIIQDFGTGDASTLVTKRVRLDGGLTIKHLPPHMNMAVAGSVDRITNPGDVGVYHADEAGNWIEESYYNQQFTQKFIVTANSTVIMPTGYSRALFQLVGAGQAPGSFGTPAAGAGKTGGFCQKLFTAVAAGGRFTVTIDTGSSGGFCSIASGVQPGGFVFPGTTFNAAGAPLQNYVLAMGNSGFGSPNSFGGDTFNDGVLGTYLAGFRAYTPGIAALNPQTGLPISPPQEVTGQSTPRFLTGLPDGGAAVALNVTGATGVNFKGGPAAVWITWMR